MDFVQLASNRNWQEHRRPPVCSCATLGKSVALELDRALCSAIPVAVILEYDRIGRILFSWLATGISRRRRVDHLCSCATFGKSLELDYASCSATPVAVIVEYALCR